jgi:hypothetical protein
MTFDAGALGGVDWLPNEATTDVVEVAALA